MTCAQVRRNVKVPRRGLTMAAWLLAMLSAAPALPLSAEEGGPIILRITGAHGARFSGDCHIGHAPAGETVHLEGKAPFERRFSETVVQCRIFNDAAARLEVTLRMPPKATATSTVWRKGQCAAVSLD